MKDIIKYSMYRFAPETFKCSVNGQSLAIEDPSTLGMMFVSGNTKGVDDEIKRIVRKIRTQRRRVTFGFYGKGNNKYFYTRELGAYDDDLQDKLRIYKEWKRYCLSRDCDLATHTVTSGEFTLNGMKNTKEKESTEIVDITRPIKIRYRYEREVI